MSEEYRFFNHIDGDRQYNAEQFAEYFRQVLTSGVLNGGENLQVYCIGTDRVSRIKVGMAWLEGYFYKNTDELQLIHADADGTYDRIDRVVLRLDRNPENRYIKAFIKTGVPALNPVPPDLTRDDMVYEVSLAQVLIVHNTSVIMADKVTDERLNNTVCGLVNSRIQADTTQIFNQFESWYASKTAEWQQDWEDWWSLHPYQYEIQWRDWFNGIQSQNYVLKEDYDQKTLEDELNIMDLSIELETLKGATLNGVTANMFIETFQSIADMNLQHGIFDSTSKKVYI